MRDVWMMFEEPYTVAEMQNQHQPEPGEARPTHRYTGLVLQFLKEPNLLRTGISDSYVEVVLLDESGPVPVVYVKPLGKCRVVRAPVPQTNTTLAALGMAA